MEVLLRIFCAFQTSRVHPKLDIRTLSMNKFLNRVSNRWRDSRLWQNSEVSTGVNKEYKRSNNDAGMTVQSRLNVMNQVRLGNYFKMGVKIYRTGRNLFCSRPLQDNIPWHTYIIRWSTLVRKVPYFVKKKLIIKHTYTQTRNHHGGQFTWSTQLIILNYPVILSYRRSTTVSLETYPLGTQTTGTAWPEVENGRMTNADRQTIEEQTNKPSNEQGHLLHNFKCFWTGIEYLIEYF